MNTVDEHSVFAPAMITCALNLPIFPRKFDFLQVKVTLSLELHQLQMHNQFSEFSLSNFNSKQFQIHLAEKLQNCKDGALRELRITNKWILSSALQKLIRRGRASEAVAVALEIHRHDPQYLRRRLPIIALEDVGIGGLQACCEVICLSSYSNWWQADSRRTIQYAVSTLSNATKSRAACDAFCLTESVSSKVQIASNFINRKPADLVDIAVDAALPQLSRLLALRVLGGISTNVHGVFQTLAPCDHRALNEVAVRLQLPPVICWLIKQQRKTAGLAAMLALTAQLGSRSEVRVPMPFPKSFDMYGGIPLCSLDQYTRLGKVVLQRYLRDCRELQDVALAVSTGYPQQLVNLAMFQIESSLLDRSEWTPDLARLKDESELQELLDVGLKDGGERERLYVALRAGAAYLAKMRGEELEKLYGLPTALESGQLRLDFL